MVLAHSVDLNAVTSGNSGPVVLFLHGITANHRVWDPIVERLSDEFRCVALDQRGHGLSEKPESGYRDLDYSDDILAVAEHFSPAEPVVVVGHSLGARNALVAASREPKRFRGVVAIDFTPFTPVSELELIASRVAQAPSSFDSVEAFRDFLTPRYPLLPADAITRRIEGGCDIAADGRVTLRASTPALVETAAGLYADLVKPVRMLEVPTLLIRGAKSPLVPDDAYHQTLALNPLVTGAIVEDTDHFVPEERPDEVARLIEGFIRGV